MKEEETSYWKRYSWLKGISYSVALGVLLITAAEANLDQQVTRLSDLVLGKVAGTVLGGGLAIGGGVTIYAGHVMKGIGQLFLAALIGIGVWLAKSGAIFSGLS
ncbi:MAG: hypothetical protein K0M45_06125 [Candidatus Paracaedibacteraceae bacterium]|nr:hypothetical protein [Candidatus Paracaedibacteraceae bacterium]